MLHIIMKKQPKFMPTSIRKFTLTRKPASKQALGAAHVLLAERLLF
jgi:hypothetical protein